MDFLLAIAMLCSVSPSTSGKGFSSNDYTPGEIDKFQLDCQQRYIHCVNTGPSNLTKQDRLEKCIMGKK